jgi:hypothetical protein
MIVAGNWQLADPLTNKTGAISIIKGLVTGF